jgi:hypothetical protein
MVVSSINKPQLHVMLRCILLTVTMIALSSTSFCQSTTGSPKNNGDNGVYTVVEKMPEYPGGMQALYRQIASTIKMPAKCRSDSAFVSCKVFLKFVVDENGHAGNEEIIKGCDSCPEANTEALKVVPKMDLWKPGTLDGRPVKVYYNLPISFKNQ